ncbi:MAG: flagellar basal body rod protein FlgB [Syntrophomonadaceae bacterium]|nr:flagellar basal body rod protein FlgB [Syntrophomonadaceae bacterium]MDD3888806.1 flagellar basal body rod protein FlgB [Syntrophomonadaceae bacterium]MDD4548219.1 flagellar basal body rod protein FlgB [Syntrophomonadaceae bacterium]
MLERIFSSPTQIMLNKSMDAAWLKNEVIADNMTNVDTPGFKRSEVIFEEKLKKVLYNSTKDVKLIKTDSKHIHKKEKDLADIDNIKPEIRTINNLSYRNDENNVDIDVEAAKMTKNKIYYDTLAQGMSNEIRLLRMAITGRG